MGVLKQVIDNTITKSNDLIEAGYKLSLNEQRLILSAISNINPGKPLPSELTVTAKDFAETFNLSENKAYEALREARDRLWERDIRTFDGRYNHRVRWVDSLAYVDGEGIVTLSFTDKVAPYLTKLNDRFTTYKLEKISSLKSVYAIRLFEMVMQYKTEGRFTISVNDLRRRFDIEDKYARFNNLRARVIEPAVKELRANSGVTIKYRPIKEGRNIVDLEFTFKLSKKVIQEI